MSKSILSTPSPEANLSHYGHDLSMSNIFSSTVGEIVPVYRHIMNPNEKISLSFQLSTRTEPLKTPGMINIEECIDVFAVPISQIYAPFKNIFFGIDDFRSNFYHDINTRLEETPSAISYLPSVSLGTVNSAIHNVNAYERYYSAARFLNGSSDATALVYDGARLACFLGLPYTSILDVSEGSTLESRQVSLLWAAAYQKIWFDYYRLTDFSANDPNCYNLDRFLFPDERSWLTSPANIAKFYTMRYVPYRKDYFMNIFTSPYLPNPTSSPSGLNNYISPDNSLVGNVSIQPRIVGYSNANYPNPEGYGVISGAETLAYSGTIMQTSVYEGTSTESGVNIQNLRAAFALQKLSETTRRSAKRYDAQLLAHFGAKVDEGDTGHVIHIGHFSQNIVSKDVVSTAASETSDGVEPLGSLAGKGYSQSQSKTFHFSTENNYGHCIIMAVYYARPVVDYYQTGLDKLDMLTDYNAFYRPEFDKLGMQPLYSSEAWYGNGADSINNQVVGYQYRYAEFKMKKDVVQGALAGVRRDWTIARIPYSNAGSLAGNPNKQRMYVSPCDVDQVFENYFEANISSAKGFGNAYELLYANDPLSHQLFVNAKLSSTMSVFGLEDL